MIKNSRDIEKEDAEKVDTAMQAIELNDFSTARNLLEEVVANTPKDYEYSYEEGDTLFVKCWGSEEFVQFVAGLNKNQRERPIKWIPSAYPRAYFCLGCIAVKKREYETALAHLEASLKL